MYAAGIAASQIISNVPAAIALRMAQDGKAWLRFRYYALPFLGVAAVVGYLLFFRQISSQTRRLRRCSGHQ